MTLIVNPQTGPNGQKKTDVEDRTLKELITDLLHEMRILNAHMSIITGDEIVKQDINTKH